MSPSLRSAALALAALLLASPVRAQQPEPLDGSGRVFRDSLVERLAGDWTMPGTVRGRPATLALHAEWVLNHQFLRLDMRDVAEPPEYQATVYIGRDNASERYVAHWIDVFGGRWSETLGYGTRVGDEVRFVFEYPDGPFHTTFTLDARTGRWTLLMQDRGANGAWREFARYELRPRPPG
jgi:hypothetical protein